MGYIVKEPNTCPAIDGIINSGKIAIEYIEDMFKDIEDVRSANASLREEAQSALDKLAEAEERIAELEQEIETNKPKE
jgi:phage shock protein A